MPSTDTKPELTAKASMAQPVSQPAVYANGLILHFKKYCHTKTVGDTDILEFSMEKYIRNTK
jgi:hypothetical protein